MADNAGTGANAKRDAFLIGEATLRIHHRAKRRNEKLAALGRTGAERDVSELGSIDDPKVAFPRKKSDKPDGAGSPG